MQCYRSESLFGCVIDRRHFRQWAIELMSWLRCMQLEASLKVNYCL